ncbi:hypothetical protein TRVA0_016S01662 [Trichomonascus vanleenenianus]|uniref:uncharacterized protein n=1 Tax=Trichomonascus vanleenenianus TaxID=2268995 RepID=UPI003EC987F0
MVSYDYSVDPLIQLDPNPLSSSLASDYSSTTLNTADYLAMAPTTTSNTAFSSPVPSHSSSTDLTLLNDPLMMTTMTNTTTTTTTNTTPLLTNINHTNSTLPEFTLNPQAHFTMADGVLATQPYITTPPAVPPSELGYPFQVAAAVPQPTTNGARTTTRSPPSPKKAVARTSLRKQSESRISLPELYQRMGLEHDHEEARHREQRVLQILRQQGFQLGERTWIRDTTEVDRRNIIDEIYNQTYNDYGYSKELIEVIIRRGSYYLMQGRLRRLRRASASLRNKEAAKQAALNVALST